MSAEIQPVNILLVEDSQDDAYFFRRALKKTGVPCECVHFWDGGALTDYLKDHSGQRHLLFLDLKIPVLNGFEVLKWIQDQNLNPHLEIVILSGSDDPKDIATARESGANDYLVKPVSVPELAQKIQTWRDKQ
jgi:CheY-like chemotaxis protein